MNGGWFYVPVFGVFCDGTWKPYTIDVTESKGFTKKDT